MFQWIKDHILWILLAIIGLIIWYVVKRYLYPTTPTPTSTPEPAKSEESMPSIDYTNSDEVLNHLEQEHIRKENEQLLHDLEEANKRKWTDEGLVQIHMQCGRRTCQFVVQLLFKDAPYACLNFMALAGLHPSIHPTYTYINTPIHRWIHNMCIQMGDVLHKDGRTIYSIYDTPYVHEGSKQLDQEGLVAMISDGPDRNGCQFMVMTQPAPWLNGTYTVFGVVVEGFTQLLRFGDMVEVDGDGKPILPVYIRQMNIYREV